MVASQLRRQIVLGELKEGDQLPSESVLMEQFGVSRPTLREAFRILEAEGAIIVRRGVRGGARVQVPEIGVAARHIGLLLQYRGALLSDVYEVRAVLEPAAARVGAQRGPAGGLPTSRGPGGCGGGRRPGGRPGGARRPPSPVCSGRSPGTASPPTTGPPPSPPMPSSTS